MSERRKIVGRRVRRARERMNLTQDELAERLGVEKKGISNVERGSDRVAIGGKLFNKIEDGLGWPEDSVVRYLETGEQSDLDALTSQRESVPEVRPLTLVEQRLMQVYILLRQMGLAEDEAKALAFQVGRQLELDEAVFVAIERQPVPVD